MKSSSILVFTQVTKVTFSPADTRRMSGCPFAHFAYIALVVATVVTDW
jgi:hypothetical protein